MIPDAQLFIRRTPGSLRPRIGDTTANVFKGGPETLLRWLETQLGLPVPIGHVANRITEYAAALDNVNDSVITNSIKTDRWAAASELLSRRDELLLAGWDETDRNGLPDVVRGLAQAASGQTFKFLGEAERLRRVLDALDDGQVLPSHICILYDPPDTWPSAWRVVLAKLTVVYAAHEN